MPPDPPEPLFAQVIVPGAVYRVQFNKPLQAGPLHFPNWEVTHLLEEWLPFAASAAARRVTIQTAFTGAFDAPDGISYLASPPDLFGVDGLPVAPFHKIPFQ